MLGPTLPDAGPHHSYANNANPPGGNHFLLLTGQPLRADARVTESFDAGGRFLKPVARNEGKAVATDELRPAGAPAKIVLATTPKKTRDVLGRPRPCHCHPRG